ncbi:MAG: DUF4982 domain-containing protein [Lachnospiraceae bacterium]|nr:DUF4982 domain-containing protein [Lachnospiraceae bacterium]
MRNVVTINDNWEFALHRGFEAMEKTEAENLQYVSVKLPHDWQVTCPHNKEMMQGAAQGYYDRWGIGWYRKEFELDDEMAGMVCRLCFDGVYENSSVWVNDIYVGGRKYGYSSFFLDITEVVHPGKNRILVKVDNTAVPADRWYSGAGIYRKVYLEMLPALHLEREQVQVLTQVEKEKAEIEIRTGTELQVRAVMSLGDAVYIADGCGLIHLMIPEPTLWSAEHPVLYDLRLQLPGSFEGCELDEITLKIGLRNVKLSSEKGLFINGESVKLKGVCIHQEAGIFGTAVQPEIWRERLKALKEVGCNALRLAHHLYMPEMLDLCDELGFYVYEECFDKWTGGAYGRYHETEWQRDLDAMVQRDRNHPSILFWGVGNEVENQAYPSMLAILEQHVARVKEMDLTRPVSLAMNPHFTYPTAEKVNMSRIADIQKFVDEEKEGEIYDIDDRVRQIQKIADRVDLISCNYQEQWYDRIHEMIPDKAILGTETFMFFCGRNYSDENPWWDVEKRDYCIGGMIWTGIDYLGESTHYPSAGWSASLFSTDMEKRPIAWIHQSNWTKEPLVRFAVMDYTIPCNLTKESWDYPRYETHWEFPQFQGVVIPHMIATNCEQVKLFINEKEFMLKPTAEYPNRTITGYLPYLQGKVTAIGLSGGKEVCRHEVVTPGPAVKLKFEEEERTISFKTEKSTPAFYQMLLKVRACDKDDNPVFRESAAVNFIVEGPANIVGADNGDLQSSEFKAGNRIHLHHGNAAVALAVIGEGRVKVSAYGAGLLPAQMVIVAVG